MTTFLCTTRARSTKFLETENELPLQKKKKLKKKRKFRTFACHSHSNYDRRSSLQKHLFYKQTYSFNLQTVISNAYPHVTFQRMPSATFWGPCDLEEVTMRSMTMEAAFLETFGVHWYVNINFSFFGLFFHFFFFSIFFQPFQLIPQPPLAYARSNNYVGEPQVVSVNTDVESEGTWIM